MPTLTVRLSEDLDARLTEESRISAISKSRLAREALSEFVSRRSRERFVAELGRAAEALDPEEAISIAEEALPLDNEALEKTVRD